MNMQQAVEYEKVSPVQIWFRQQAIKLGGERFKKALVDQTGQRILSLDPKAPQNHEPTIQVSTDKSKGGEPTVLGEVYYSTHFSKGDPPRILLSIVENPRLLDRVILAPVAIHQYNFPYVIGSKLLGFIFCPIYTKDTWERIEKKKLSDEEKEKHRAKDKLLLDNYFSQSLRVLAGCGIAVVFPQGGRRPFLDKVMPAVSPLLEMSIQAGVDNYALNFLGISIKGVSDYGDQKLADSINLGREYQIKVGNRYLRNEFIRKVVDESLKLENLTHEELQAYREGKNIFTRRQHLAFCVETKKELELVSPEGYLKAS